MVTNQEVISLNDDYFPIRGNNLLNLIKQIFPFYLKKSIEFEFITYNHKRGDYGDASYSSKKRITYRNLVKNPSQITSFLNKEYGCVTDRQITISSRVYVNGAVYYWLMFDLLMYHQNLQTCWGTGLLQGQINSAYGLLPYPYYIQTENSYHCYYPLLVNEELWNQIIADQLFIAQFSDVNKEYLDLPWLIATNQRGYGTLRVHKGKWLPSGRKFFRYLPVECKSLHNY